MVLAYLLAITTLVVSVGRLGDITGRRQLLMAGVLLFTVVSALCGGAPTLWFLIVARVAQGLGAAIMMALTMAFVSEAVPKAKVGSAMGLLGTMSAAGTALGPSLGGLLISALGWQAIFFINVPLGLTILVLIYRYLPVDANHHQANQPRFDLVGTFLPGMRLAAYSLAMTVGRGHFGLRNMALLVTAVLGLGVFIVAERRARSPLVRLTRFLNASLDASLLMSLLVSTVMMATLVVGPFHLSRTLGLSAGHLGLVLSIGPLFAMLAGIPAGHLVDTVGAHWMTWMGLVGIAVGCVLLSALSTPVGMVGYIVPIIVLTIGYALFQTANNTAVMMDVHHVNEASSPVCSTSPVMWDSSPVHPSWAPCSASHRGLPTSALLLRRLWLPACRSCLPSRGRSLSLRWRWRLEPVRSQCGPCWLKTCRDTGRDDLRASLNAVRPSVTPF